MPETVTISLIFVGVGALFVAVGYPLLRGRVPPNYWYGYRTRWTLSDEEVWYRVNRVTGRDMIEAGFAVLVVSLTLLAFSRRMNADTATVVLLFVMLAGVARMVVHGQGESRRA